MPLLSSEISISDRIVTVQFKFWKMFEIFSNKRLKSVKNLCFIPIQLQHYK